MPTARQSWFGKVGWARCCEDSATRTKVTMSEGPRPPQLSLENQAGRDHQGRIDTVSATVCIPPMPFFSDESLDQFEVPQEPQFAFSSTLMWLFGPREGFFVALSAGDPPVYRADFSSGTPTHSSAGRPVNDANVGSRFLVRADHDPAIPILDAPWPRIIGPPPPIPNSPNWFCEVHPSQRADS